MPPPALEDLYLRSWCHQHMISVFVLAEPDCCLVEMLLMLSLSFDSPSPLGQSHRSEVLRHRIKDFQRHVQQTA